MENEGEEENVSSSSGVASGGDGVCDSGAGGVLWCDACYLFRVSDCDSFFTNFHSSLYSFPLHSFRNMIWAALGCARLKFFRANNMLH